MSNLEIAFKKIMESGLTAEQKQQVKVEASKNPGIAEGIKLEDPVTDDFLIKYLCKENIFDCFVWHLHHLPL